MRLRDLFRSQSSNERKPTSSILAVHAASDKDTETLQKYLLAGFPPDQPDPLSRTTALHAAVESSNVRAIHLLLQAGAQVNLCDSSLSTPLHIAATMGSEEMVHLLLSHAADAFLPDNTGRNSFHLAVSNGHNRLIPLFLSMIDPELRILHTPDAQHWTPLMCACASNYSSTCAVLLSHGADLCASNDRGMNVFHIAAFLGSLPLIHEFLNTSNDEEIVVKALNQGDLRNQTPLFYACIEGHLEIALLFLHAGANAHHLDTDRQTCLHAMLASSIVLKRHIRLFYRLIDLVDYRLEQDHLGRTLLDLAHLNQLRTISSLLVYLHYPSNFDLISTRDSSDESIRSTLSLRQLCVLSLKRSLRRPPRTRPWTCREHVENAFQQCFQLNINGEHPLTEVSHRKSLDDLTAMNKKSFKSAKKSRKTSSMIGPTQLELDPTQHSQFTWSLLTNKFKHQRISGANQELPKLSTSSPTSSALIVPQHPMRHLALALMHSPTKLDDLLDFPSFNRSPYLESDLKATLQNYNLKRSDSSNQI